MDQNSYLNAQNRAQDRDCFVSFQCPSLPCVTSDPNKTDVNTYILLALGCMIAGCGGESQAPAPYPRFRTSKVEKGGNTLNTIVVSVLN
jgi:hypothetical protein